jgi:hypothetical protein
MAGNDVKRFSQTTAYPIQIKSAGLDVLIHHSCLATLNAHHIQIVEMPKSEHMQVIKRQWTYSKV